MTSRILCTDGMGILSAASSMKLSPLSRLSQLQNVCSNVWCELHWWTSFYHECRTGSCDCTTVPTLLKDSRCQRNNNKMVSKNSGRCSIHCEIFIDNPKASKKNKSRHQGRRGIFQNLLGWVFQIYIFKQVPSNNLWQAQTTKKHLRYH